MSVFLFLIGHGDHRAGLTVVLTRKEKKIKRLEIKKINMEIWELLKSLFSEVNFLLKCLSRSRSSVQSHWWRQVQNKKRSLWAETGSSAWTVRTDSQEEQIPKRRMRQSLLQFRKAIFLASAFLFEQCAMLSKRLTNTVACCYETYRMRREGGELRALSHFFIIFFLFTVATSRQTRHKRMQRKSAEDPGCSHVGVIYWECLYYWRNLPQLHNWGYFVKRGAGPHPL